MSNQTRRERAHMLFRPILEHYEDMELDSVYACPTLDNRDVECDSIKDFLIDLQHLFGGKLDLADMARIAQYEYEAEVAEERGVTP